MSSDITTPITPDFKVYRPPATNPNTPQSLPDSYFTPTLADIRDSQAVLTARSKALNDAPLELKSVREAREKERLARWPTTTIRIKFTDRTMLEKTFPSTNKMRNIYAFVRSSLREDVQSIKFVLYQLPRQELKVSDPEVKEKTLAQLQLAPSSVLYLSFFEESMNKPDYPAPLAESVLAQAIDLPQPPQEVDVPASEASGSNQKLSLSSSGSTSGEKKVPKWFKLGKK